VTYNTAEDKAAQVFKSFRGSDISEIEATFIRRTIIVMAHGGKVEVRSSIDSADHGTTVRLAFPAKL
jgi:signal transduction histidine kinase